MNYKRKARLIAEKLKSKKAEDIVIMNIRKITDITYYYVICSATSSIHAQTLARELEEKIGSPWHMEGYSYANWILLDYIDVVVHIFLEPTREYYGLERLFADVPMEKMVK